MGGREKKGENFSRFVWEGDKKMGSFSFTSLMTDFLDFSSLLYNGYSSLMSIVS